MFRVRVTTSEGDFGDLITDLASLLKWKNIPELFLEFGALFWGGGVSVRK